MNLKIHIVPFPSSSLAALRGVCGGPAAEGVPVAREAAHPDAVGALRPLLGLPAAAPAHLHGRLRVHAEGARGEQRGDVFGTDGGGGADPCFTISHDDSARFIVIC